MKKIVFSLMVLCSTIGYSQKTSIKSDFIYDDHKYELKKRYMKAFWSDENIKEYEWFAIPYYQMDLDFNLSQIEIQNSDWVGFEYQLSDLLIGFGFSDSCFYLYPTANCKCMISPKAHGMSDFGREWYHSKFEVFNGFLFYNKTNKQYVVVNSFLGKERPFEIYSDSSLTDFIATSFYDYRPSEIKYEKKGTKVNFTFINDKSKEHYKGWFDLSRKKVGKLTKN